MLGWVQSELRHFPAPWFVAGGWALDLFADAQSRHHADVDIAIFREDQVHLPKALPGWAFAKAESRELRPWPPHEYLELPIHEIHAKGDDSQMEFLLNERRLDSWVYRRNAAITLPLPGLGSVSSHGVPYLAPQVVLLYKAKAPRATDEADFVRTTPLLSPSARVWLASALELCHPDHPWRAVLQSNVA